ncbi:MAG: BatD family protein [Planctomycetota bacterium]
MVRRLLTLLVLTALTSAAFAQKQQTAGRAELRFDTVSLEVGESIVGQLIFTNSGVPRAPALSAPDGLELSLLSTTPSFNQSIQMSGTRRVDLTQYTFGIRLTGKKAGKYALGPFTLDCEGSSLTTRPLEVSVRNVVPTSESNGDKLVYAEIQVQPTRIFVTQSYSATLMIGVRKVEIAGRVHEVDNFLNTILDGRSTQLANFAGKRYTESDISLPDSKGVRHSYKLYKIQTDVRAEDVGEVAIGPVFLRVNYPLSLQRGVFGGTELGETKSLSVRAEGPRVTILGPPEEGRPGDFSGAIGQYTLHVSAKPDHVVQGQPVTLSVGIRGNPLDGLAAPNLTTQPELASRFDFTPEEPGSDIEAGAKVFRKAIFPKQHGEQTVPPLTWTFFDPRQEKYVTLRSEPIPISVAPASESHELSGSDSTAANGPSAITLKVLSGGLSPNHVDVQSALASQAVLSTTNTVVPLTIAPLIWLAITLTTKHRARLREDVTWARRRNARRNAERRIRSASREASTKESIGALGDAAIGYIADRFNLPAGTLTPSEAKTVLENHGVHAEIVQEILGFLERCDAARFAPSSLDSLSVVDLSARVRKWVDRIEKVPR